MEGILNIRKRIWKARPMRYRIAPPSNGLREMTRRFKQIAAGQLKPENRGIAPKVEG